MSRLSSVTGIILAGGLGTRLRPVLADRPKVLAEVRGRPFLQLLLNQLAGAGIERVVLCTGYLGDHISALFGNSYANLDLAYSQESSPLGTAGALRLALPFLESEHALVMNGDSYCDVDLNDFWVSHIEYNADATLLLVKVPDTRRYGRVRVGDEGQIIHFEEKNQEGGPGWINAGMYLVRKDLFHSIPSGGPVSIEHDVFPAWTGRGLHAYQSRGRFLDIGTPRAYAEAEQFFSFIEDGKRR